jgi:hypothetical protein
MQVLIALGFVCLAAVLAMQWPYWLWAVWGFLWLIALASATHDVAADGFYLRSLDQQSQASFVGVRSLAFRLAMLSVSGGFVGLVGKLLEQSNDPFDVWSQAFLILALGVATLCFWHGLALPGKQQGQANFVNPGLFLYNVGIDFELTPKLKLINNVSYLRFNQTDVIETLRQDGSIDNEIGFDFSSGILYRPFLNNNVQIRVGAATLLPGAGLKNLYGSEPLYDVFSNLILAF